MYLTQQLAPLCSQKLRHSQQQGGIKVRNLERARILLTTPDSELQSKLRTPGAVYSNKN